MEAKKERKGKRGRCTKERNERRHGSAPAPVATLIRFIDRQVKNNCLSISAMGNHKYGALLQRWLASQA
ncbi:hypothetical protein Bca4012_069157 [Brassica carinata]